MRHRVDVMYIWMDTICINQHDNIERSRQVAKMLTIYQKADKVMIYLGEHSDVKQFPDGRQGSPTEWVIDLLGNDKVLNLFSEPFTSMASQILTSKDSGGKLCMSHEALLKQGVQGITANPYYDRIWVRQEIWAASSVEILYGASVYPWTRLKELRTFVQSLQPLLSKDIHSAISELSDSFHQKLDKLVIGSPIAHAASTMKDKPNPRLRDTEEYSLDIINVLRRASHAKSSCLHDRVYALLGMTTVNVYEKEGPYINDFEVNYSDHPVDVFAHLAKYIIYRDNSSLNVLFLSLLSDRTSKSREMEGQYLPSWVPDWRSEIGALPPYEGVPPSWLKREISLPTQIGTRRVLVVRGYFLGTLESRVTHINQRNGAIRWTHPLLREMLPENATLPNYTLRWDQVVLLDGASWPALVRRVDYLKDKEAKRYICLGPVLCHRTLRDQACILRAVRSFCWKIQDGAAGGPEYFRLV
jgi:hypothetical protein